MIYCKRHLGECSLAASFDPVPHPFASKSDRAVGYNRTRNPLTVLLAAVGFISLPAAAETPVTALPIGGVVSAGSAVISQSGAAMRVNQLTAKAVIDWQSFSIGREANVHFQQPSTSAIALNRVGSEGGRSIIDGSLTANGQVWLLNPGGVLFSQTARIDVGGLLATSLKLNNDDFLNGNYRFTKDGVGSILNQGTLTAADGGYVALLAPQVRNEGVVSARLGTAVLASGEEIRVDFAGDRLIEIKVDKAALNGLIDNRNLVEAEGGWVLMSAGAASDLASGAINSTGILRATSFTNRAGVIRLEGGFVALGGTVNADGEAGGRIQVATSRDLSLAELVTARGATGTGGAVDYSVGGRVIETTTSRIDVSGLTDGGSIRVVADGGILSSGTYNATGASGHGGRIDLSGSGVRLLSATLAASGATQGGLVRIGGAYQGGKVQDFASDTWQHYIGRFGTLPDLPNAQRSFINDSTRIDVSSKGGAGGTVIAWSDLQTTFLGGIKAERGAVEISSAGDLRYVNLAGLDLGTGFLLLDPKNIVIGDFPTAGTWTYQAILGKGYSGGKNVDVGSLEANDNFSTSVALNATGDRLAVGAVTDDGFGNAFADSGAVRLFSFTDTSFSGGALQATLGKGYVGGKNVDVSGLEAGDWFGISVAFNASGNRLAVGAPYDAGNGNISPASGAAYLFSFADTNFSGGTLQATLGKGYLGGKNVDVSTLEGLDFFGRSVALNAAGDRLAVGAPLDDGSGNAVADSGAVRLFSFTDANFSGGTLQSIVGKGYAGGKDLDVSSLETNDYFGISVALNAAGDRLAAGALNDAGSGNIAAQSGAAYLFSFTDTDFSGAALQATVGKGYSGGKNVDVGSLEAVDQFGSAIALNAAGDRLAVGASNDAGSGNIAPASGAAYLFSFANTNFSGGTLQATLGKGYTGGKNVDVSSLEAGDAFGTGIALNAVGDRLAVGAQTDAGSGNSVTNSGAVYLFSYSTQPTSNLQFSTNPSAIEYIDRAGLQALLSAGTNVTLQASNDIIWNGGSNLVVNNPVGNGGALTLQAGRSVLINSSIFTDNADLTVIANSTLADGVVDADRDPGAANIAVSSGSSINVGTGIATFIIKDGAGLTYNTPGTITGVFATSGMANSAVTTTETTVSQESAAAGTFFPTIDASIVPVGGTGSGGATMSGFSANGTTAETATSANEPQSAPSISSPEPAPLPRLVVDARRSLPTLAKVLNRSDLQTMSQRVHEANSLLFADALALLAKDPIAADIADCGSGGDEICIATRSVVQESYLPVVKRKLAVLIGNNNYRSPIGDLDTAINDVTAIGAELRDKMGYEVKLVRNADRKDIVDALNGLIRSTERDDSVVVMYAGHGYLQESTKTGYWLPIDADASKPDKWISNDTIARALRNIPAKQVMLVSDSCYSGLLTREGRMTETVGISREQMLTRRSVLALSSGGEEPVSDEGHDNHSIFAWNMIRSLRQMTQETSGQQLHAMIRDAVAKDFPQVPQYGSVISAGHADGGEYLVTPTTKGSR